MSGVTFWSASDPFVTVAEVVDRFHRDLGVRLRVHRWVREERGEDVDGLERVVDSALLLEPSGTADALGGVVLSMRYVTEGDAEAYDRCMLAGKPPFSDVRVVADIRAAEPGRDELVPGVVAVLSALYPGGVEAWPEGRNAFFGADVTNILGTVEPAARRKPEERSGGLFGWVSRLFRA